MKLLAALPVVLVALAVAPPVDAFFHWAPWTGSGVAAGASGAYTMTLAYQGRLFYSGPHPVTITLTDAAGQTSSRTFYAHESFPCERSYGGSEFLCLNLASDDAAVPFTGFGVQDASQANREFTVAVQGSYLGLTYAVAALNQPF